MRPPRMRRGGWVNDRRRHRAAQVTRAETATAAITDFATPTWQEGVGRLVDFGNTLTEYNRSANPDARAMAQDWGAVGEFLAVALDDRPDCG